MKKLRMRRECFLIQLLALVLMCGCARVETVDEADAEVKTGKMSAKSTEAYLDKVWVKLQAEVEAGNMSAKDAEAKMIAIKKKSAVNAKTDAYLKQVWAKLQAEVEAGNMSAEDAEAKMIAIKKDAATKTKSDVFTGQEYKLTSDSLEQEGVPEGTVTKHIWDNSGVYPGTTRDYYIYVPAQYDNAKPACVMVFQDGAWYVDPRGPARVATVFDNLISKGEMPVTIGIFIDPGRKGSVEISDDTRVPSLIGKTLTTEERTWVFGEDGRLRLSGGKTLAGRYEQDGPNVIIQIDGKDFKAIYDGEKLHLDDAQDQRGIEYTSLGDRYARFLLEEILPEVGKDYNLVDDAQGRAICGASNGGICAFTVAWERPDVFSKVVSHVGSFTDIRGGHIYPTLIRKSRSNPKPIRVFLQTGEHDLNIEVGNWTLANRQMESALKYARYDYRFVMGDGGHDLEHGGAIFPETLRWIWRDYPGVKGADESAIKKTKARGASPADVPSLVGKTLTIEEGEDEYTLVFREDGETFISGGELGEGVEARYEQEGRNVHIEIGEEELEAIYDGETLEIQEEDYRPEGYNISAVTVDDYEPRTFTSLQGDTIQYRLFVPRDYDADRNYPLILFHHGAGGSGNDNRRQFEGPCPREWAGPERQAKNTCFIVAPQIPRNRSRNREDGPPRTVIMREHSKTIHEILDHLEKEFSIDTSREYVTGLSMGGECTWVSIIERPDRFAAAVPICAGDKFIGMDAEERGKTFAQFPLWIFHGDADDVISVNVSRKVVKALRDAGGNPKYTEYPGVGHDSWTRAYRDSELIEWLFAQSRKPGSR